MSWLSSIFGFFRSFQCWVTVAPWESGLRVRLGKTATVLHPGPHLRIPFLDRIFIQPVRLRTIEPPTITLTTNDRESLTMKICVVYQIEDIKKLHMMVANPESALLTHVQDAIASFVGKTNRSELTADSVREHAASCNLGIDWGLRGVRVLVSTFSFCRAMRLLMQDYQSTSTTNNLPSTTDQM